MRLSLFLLNEHDDDDDFIISRGSDLVVLIEAEILFKDLR